MGFRLPVQLLTLEQTWAVPFLVQGQTLVGLLPGPLLLRGAPSAPCISEMQHPCPCSEGLPQYRGLTTRGPERTSQKQKTAQRTTRFPYLPGDPPPGPPKKAEAPTGKCHRPGLPLTGRLGPLRFAVFPLPTGSLQSPLRALSGLTALSLSRRPCPQGFGHSREAAAQGACPGWAIFLGGLRV